MLLRMGCVFVFIQVKETTTTKAMQSFQNISHTFSGLTGESSESDYQVCGMSSVPLYPYGSESSPFLQNSRGDAVMRYKAKKKARK